ncbi:MtN3-like protein [Phytophthora cinnamomi]|uniref:MtN3-like protein n=1 Tax=Phytophthora cinnamomi TaxID=4785 RepID=UPI00355A1D1C|nr:MtN3-like protein [Phytophthora cinnamomi]
MAHSDVVMAVRVWIWCSTLLMIYMPSLFVRRIYRERATGSASIVPIVLVLANSHVWMLYGYLGKTWFPSFPVFLIGDVVSLSYLFIFWRYSSDRRRVAKTIAAVLAVLMLPTFYVVVASLGFTGQSRKEVWKTQGLCFCDVTVISIHMLMLKNLVRAFTQRSAATLLPRSLAVSSFNSLGWFTFGRVTSNWIIAGPQVFVIALHLAAWTMYVVFTRRTKPQTAFAAMEEGSVVMSVDLSPKVDFDVNAKEITVPNSPEYQVLRSPLAPLHP